MTQEMLTRNKSANFDMGMAGELFVLQYEKRRLPEDMHPAIQHNSDKDIAKGFDILSFEKPESVKPDRYIEVKTYRGHKHFYWSEGEITIARLLSEHYYLYLVDYDRINETDYKPEIIQNPARLFDTKDEWICQPIKYVFSELSSTNIPEDWFKSIILIGCYNTQSHLQWILSNNLYNVRARISTSKHGEIDINDKRVQNARYLLLYQTGALQNYMLFELTGKPRLSTADEIISLGYAKPHSAQYILHTISHRLPDFHINLQQLFREALPKMGDSIFGQPLYLSGRQLTNFIPKRPDKAKR